MKYPIVRSTAIGNNPRPNNTRSCLPKLPTASVAPYSGSGASKQSTCQQHCGRNHVVEVTHAQSDPPSLAFNLGNRLGDQQTAESPQRRPNMATLEFLPAIGRIVHNQQIDRNLRR